MQLSGCVNAVYSEFGGVIPPELLSFEDVAREFLSCRQLEMQKLGISTTNITTNHVVITPSAREGTLTVSGADQVIPSFVELIPKNQSSDLRIRYKVEIIPVELVADYEGSRAIAFFGFPQKYLLAWDAWKYGDLDLWYDPVEDLTTFNVTKQTDIIFPKAFWTFLFKKTALNLIKIVMLKLMTNTSSHISAYSDKLSIALKMFYENLSLQVNEWEIEMMKYRNLDLNTQPHLRRTMEEILLNDYNNITDFTPGDAS